MLNDTIYIGDVTVQPSRRLVIAGEREEVVDPLVMKLLLTLAERRGAVATRDELIRDVWPDGFAADANLSRAVWGLRRALCDDAENPRYVETVPRVGYRLIPEVRIAPHKIPGGDGAVTDGSAVTVEVGESSRRPTENYTNLAIQHARLQVRVKWLQRTIGVLGVTLVGLVLFVMLFRPAPEYENVEVMKVRNDDGTVDSTVVTGSAGASRNWSLVTGQ